MLTASMVHQVFGIDSSIVTDPLSGRPMMLPIGRHRMARPPFEQERDI